MQNLEILSTNRQIWTVFGAFGKFFTGDNYIACPLRTFFRRVHVPLVPCRSDATALERKLESYRCYELHTTYFNHVFLLFNDFSHPMCMAVAICSIYAAVRTRGVLAAVAANWAFMGLAICLPWVGSYAKINYESSAALESLRRNWGRVHGVGHSDWKVSERKMRSMRELRICSADSRYYYDKALVLTTVEIILTQSVNILVMY